MKKLMLIAAATAFCLAGANAALADDCSGHSHDTGTVLGAAGGAAIGGLASKNVGGAIAGGVIGGLAGNAIDRSQDCAKTTVREEDAARHAYNQGYEDRAAEEVPAQPPPNSDFPD